MHNIRYYKWESHDFAIYQFNVLKQAKIPCWLSLFSVPLQEQFCAPFHARANRPFSLSKYRCVDWLQTHLTHIHPFILITFCQSTGWSPFLPYVVGSFLVKWRIDVNKSTRKIVGFKLIEHRSYDRIGFWEISSWDAYYTSNRRMRLLHAVVF
jgi:hypothetical protein